MSLNMIRFSTTIPLAGISYLSRVQESIVKERNPIPQIQPVSLFSSLSVADSIFMSRIKSRVVHWWNACKESSNTIDGWFSSEA